MNACFQIEEWRKQKAELLELQMQATNEKLKKVEEEKDGRRRLNSAENKIKVLRAELLDAVASKCVYLED